ncbi:MAG: PQQ-binding-like beta-propeller repeat protein [Terriglobales bacterium]
MRINAVKRSLCCFKTMAPRLLACASLLLGLALSSSQASAEDWPKYKHDLANTGQSGETGISSANVASLKTKWTYATGGLISASPAVATVNGTSMVFIGSWNGVFSAINAITGQFIWSFTVDFVGNRCSIGQHWCRIGSSAAVDTVNNLVFFGSYNAYLYALNATTGKVVWKQAVGSSKAGYEVWSSPAIYNGAVYIGVSSHGDEPCTPGGQVNAYDELTGAPIWTFNTLDQTTCPGGGTCVGTSVWASVAVDNVNGIIYAGTGNPGSTCTPPTQNAGLYPDSILAIGARTGTLLNYFQAIKNDVNDKDFGSSPFLYSTSETDQCTGSSTTNLWVSDASKNGYLYTVERDASGLVGDGHQIFSSASGFIGTPSLRPVRATSVCDTGTGKKIIDNREYIFAPGTGGALWTYLLDGGTQTTTLVRRTKFSPMSAFASPAVIQDVAMFGATDGNFYVAAKYGKILQTFPIGTAPIYSGTAISNGRVYFGSTDGTVYCLSIDGN